LSTDGGAAAPGNDDRGRRPRRGRRRPFPFGYPAPLVPQPAVRARASPRRASTPAVMENDQGTTRDSPAVAAGPRRETARPPGAPPARLAPVPPARPAPRPQVAGRLRRGAPGPRPRRRRAVSRAV